MKFFQAVKNVSGTLKLFTSLAGGFLIILWSGTLASNLDWHYYGGIYLVAGFISIFPTMIVILYIQQLHEKFNSPLRSPA